jgi:hypothetical protein
MAYSAGQILTAASLESRLWDKVGETVSIVNGSAFTNTAVDSLSITWTATSPRIYRLHVRMAIQSDVVNDICAVYLTDAANTVLQQCRLSSPVVNQPVTYYTSIDLTGLTGSVTYKARHVRQAGTGNCTRIAVAGLPSILWVDDIGS